MYKNRRLLAFITSICTLSMIACSTEIISFADEENITSNEDFNTNTMDNFNDYITFSQGIIYFNGIDASSDDATINLEVESNWLDSDQVVTKGLTVDIPILITENPGFTQANMNLSIVNVDENNPINLEYNILNSSGIAEKNGNSIQLSSSEVCSSDTILLTIQITIPKNTIKNGDMFDINFTDVELINEDNKYTPSVPEHLSLIITDDSDIDSTTIIGKPIEEDTEYTSTQDDPIETTVSYTSTMETEPTITTEEPPPTTNTTVATFTSKEDSKTTTTTKITTIDVPTNTSKTTTTTLISSGSGSGTTTTITKVPDKSTSNSNSSKGSSSNSKGSSNTSKSESVSQESSQQELEPPKLGSRGILGIVMASLVSISTAFATRKKS